MRTPATARGGGGKDTMSRAGQTDGPVIDIHWHREDAIAANVTAEGGSRP